MYTVNNSNKGIGNKGNSYKASRYTTHIAYTEKLYKPMNMNANPSINAYKHHIAYIRNGHKVSPIPTWPMDDN